VATTFSPAQYQLHYTSRTACTLYDGPIDQMVEPIIFLRQPLQHRQILIRSSRKNTPLTILILLLLGIIKNILIHILLQLPPTILLILCILNLGQPHRENDLYYSVSRGSSSRMKNGLLLPQNVFSKLCRGDRNNIISILQYVTPSPANVIAIAVVSSLL
jgi:hypothetical protein